MAGAGEPGLDGGGLRGVGLACSAGRIGQREGRSTWGHDVTLRADRGLDWIDPQGRGKARYFGGGPAGQCEAPGSWGRPLCRMKVRWTACPPSFEMPQNEARRAPRPVPCNPRRQLGRRYARHFAGSTHCPGGVPHPNRDGQGRREEENRRSGYVPPSCRGLRAMPMCSFRPTRQPCTRAQVQVTDSVPRTWKSTPSCSVHAGSPPRLGDLIFP